MGSYPCFSTFHFNRIIVVWSTPKSQVARVDMRLNARCKDSWSTSVAAVSTLMVTGGTGGELDNKEVGQAVLEVMGEPVDAYDHVVDPPRHDRRYAIDSSKLRAELGWVPRFSDVRSGLEDTVRWHRDHEDWWRPPQVAVEAMYGTSCQ
jgi:dTDP-glucose 4,6-dehydratase